MVATCSEKNASHVRELGADDVIDYKAHDSMTKYLTEKYCAEPLDIVLDTVGNQELYTHSLRYLKSDGPVVNVGINEESKRYCYEARMRSYQKLLVECRGNMSCS